MPGDALGGGRARLVGQSWHRVAGIAERYVDLALAQADYSQAAAIERLAENVRAHWGNPDAIRAVSINMSPAYIKGVPEHLPNASLTFVKFHVIAHASHARDLARRAEQRRDPALKGLRWILLKYPARLSDTRRADLDARRMNLTTKRTARAWQYREDLREMLRQWYANVMRQEVEPMKAVARMIRPHLKGIVAWAITRLINCFLEARNGLFHAAKRKARGYRRLWTIRTIIFLIAGTLYVRTLNPHAA